MMNGCGHLKMAGMFTRFSEKRDTVISDITTYDDVVDGIEPDESAGLHIPIPEDNIGFKIIQRMGWKSGRGLGRNRQGRTDPVPLKLKDDFMGLGRFQHELDLAVEATEKRKQMEIEKEITPDLLHKYKSQMDREKTIAESTSDLRQSYYCELCDKQYNKYSEYDNHLNSYDHHHRQRLKTLKEYEVGRKFGSHKTSIVNPNKTASAQIIALERAEMRAQRKLQQTGFKPMGYRHGKHGTPPTVVTPFETSNAAITSALRKRSSEGIMESEKKIAEKKARLEKYGVKFQSAGHLATINEKESSTLSSYQSSLFNATHSLNNNNTDGSDKHHQHSSSSGSNNISSLYGGRFVTSLSGTEQSTVKEKDTERDKRLSSLPQAKGRKSEQLAAIKAATTNKDEGDGGEEGSDEEGFVFGQGKIPASFGKPKIKLPVKQMSLKLSNKYESYYH